jgi:hypothetical protein
MKQVLLLAALCAGIVATPAGTVSISDGDFSTWTFGSFGTAGGTATATRETTDGNPGARINVTTVTTTGQSAFGTALNPTQFSEALEDQPFTLSLDVLSGAGAFGAVPQRRTSTAASPRASVSRRATRRAARSRSTTTTSF